MDYDKLKKIPLFKNSDFSDPKQRSAAKRLILMLTAIPLIIILMVASKERERKAAQAAAEPQEKESFLSLPQGEDNEILDATNPIEARKRAMNNRNRQKNYNELIFNSAGGGRDTSSVNIDEDPLGVITGGGNGKPAEDDNSHLTARQKAAKALGLSTEPVTPASTRTAADENADNENGNTTPLTPEQREKAAREARSQGRTASAAPSTTARQTAPPKEMEPEEYVEERRAEEEKEDTKPEPEPAPLIRKSNSISSLDGDFGTIEGISSLDQESAYITEDSKPYKVMFTKEMTITSGQRVNLRLLEDMVADGILIPKNTHLSASVSIGNRIAIEINSIEMNGKIYDIHAVAYDTDGNKGLYCPQSELDRVGRQTANRAVSTANGTATGGLSSTASTGGDATSMAIGATRVITDAGVNIIRSTNNSIKVKVSPGYTFYIMKEERE